MAISAATVKELRDRTGQAMMDCKKALQETDGDMERAVELLRKKGMAVLEKRTGRATKEGRVVSKISDDGQKAVLVSLCCETDFTAKSEQFGETAATIADLLLNAENAPDNAEALAAMPCDNGRTVNDLINDLLSTTGEKTSIGEFARYDLTGPGVLFCYVHFNNKVGTLIQIDAASAAAAEHQGVQAVASDLAMHVTASKPVAVSPDELDPELVAREKEVAAAQIQNKPEHIVEKIVTGKINKWFAEVALLEQPFVKDDSKQVKELLAEVGKEAGGDVSVNRFCRVQLGE